MEEGWSVKDLAQSRINVLVGFPLRGLLSVAIAGCAAVVLLPAGIAVTSLSQVILPVAEGAGNHPVQRLHAGAVFGWSWGKFRRPAQ